MYTCVDNKVTIPRRHIQIHEHRHTHKYTYKPIRSLSFGLTRRRRFYTTVRCLCIPPTHTHTHTHQPHKVTNRPLTPTHNKSRIHPFHTQPHTFIETEQQTHMRTPKSNWNFFQMDTHGPTHAHTYTNTGVRSALGSGLRRQYTANVRTYALTYRHNLRTTPIWNEPYPHPFK